MNNTQQKKNRGNYPSMLEILREPGPEINPEIIRTLKLWKKCWYKKWKELRTEEKLQRLFLLVEVIWELDESNVLNSTEFADYYAWNPVTKTLLMDTERPSIISTLHEIGHSLYGKSELEACRFSVWCFKTVFPKSFNSLKTERHMLKQI